MIYRIDGPAKSGRSFLANALRNHAILHKRGCLLIDEDQNAPAAGLLAKLFMSALTPDMTGEDGQLIVDKLPWKTDPVIIVVGDHGAKVLAEIERLAPGFAGRFGPASVLTLTAGA